MAFANVKSDCCLVAVVVCHENFVFRVECKYSYFIFTVQTSALFFRTVFA